MKENGNTNGKPHDWGRVLVCTRLEKTVDNEFVAAWSHLISQGLRKGDGWMIVKDRTAHEAANEAARQFLKSPYDSILYIDSDWDGGPTFLEELRNVPEGWEYDAFQAFYTRRGWPPEAIWFKYSELGDLMQCIVWKDDHTEEVALVGLHCTLIRKSVFEGMLAANPEIDPDQYSFFYYPRNQQVSEDAAFSGEATKLGYKLGATTAVKAGHIGRATTGWQTYQEYLQLSGAVSKWERYYYLVELIADFTGESYDTVIAKAMHGSRYPRERFNASAPETPEQVRAFYGDPENGYLYDLLAWNVSQAYAQITAGLREYSGKRALVIGAGLGEEAEQLKGRNNVEAFELSGVLADFLTYRYEDTPVEELALYDAPVFSAGLFGDWSYDLIVAIDTLEHIHPDEFEETLDEILACLAPDGELYLHNNWGNQEQAPQHFDNSAAFEKWLEGNNLYQSGSYTYRRLSEHEKITG